MADKYVPPHAQAMLFQFKIEKRRAEDLLRADRVSEILDRLQAAPSTERHWYIAGVHLVCPVKSGPLFAGQRISRDGPGFLPK